jgi:hypothetical protein
LWKRIYGAPRYIGKSSAVGITAAFTGSDKTVHGTILCVDRGAGRTGDIWKRKEAASAASKRRMDLFNNLVGY